MLSLINQLKPFVAAFRDEKGVTTVEYAIMLVLVALAVAAFGTGLSGAVTGVFQDMITELSGAS